MSQHLIIFTRFPEPGKTKTRLIPALGALGAAQLHRQLAEQMLAQAKSLSAILPISLEVCFTGGSLTQMQQWLGGDLTYCVQGTGDLGARMSQAFQRSFEAGMKRVAIAGTDCPHLEVSVLAQAFEQLEQHDLVLGTAKDGGYYLIGLQRLYPELLVGIDWGTSRVFEQTAAIAQRLNLSRASLPELADIDRPEDLGLLH
uniref:TIGR04282 family arsenosugar biosynthesis glycosyltransferase n=1 Tax=Desertifilum tharense IPPAS B-1220 TaxID=1781255 RepID=A0ACD5GUA8_9CYAN